MQLNQRKKQMTINELLLTPYYRGNQSLLAKDLNVNRGTLRKYMTDIKGEFHLIKTERVLGKQLFTNQSNKECK